MQPEYRRAKADGLGASNDARFRRQPWLPVTGSGSDAEGRRERDLRKPRETGPDTPGGAQYGEFTATICRAIWDEFRNWVNGAAFQPVEGSVVGTHLRGQPEKHHDGTIQANEVFVR